MVLLFAVYLTFELLKYFKIHISAVFQTMHLIFGKLKYFWTSLEKWSSSQNLTSWTDFATI